MFEHEHPLNLIDLWPHNEEESDEDEDENDDLDTEQDFKCRCNRCEEEINWFHRYFYKCDHCHYSIHKFCGDLPATLEHPFHLDHTLTLTQYEGNTWCNICYSYHGRHTLCYHVSHYGSHYGYSYDVDLQCATGWLKTNIIHHPSHKHPLVRTVKPIICECDACGKEHKGFFYQCITCPYPLIHTDCAFLSKKILIQQATNDIFTHTHPLTLAYSFTRAEQDAKNNPKCRVCSFSFYPKFWIYKCDKCRYYAHIDCATSRGEPFMSIFMRPGTGKLLKNYEDNAHPNLLHLPFPDESYSLLKTLFFNKSGSTASLETTKLHISHQHPLILVDVTSPASSSRTKNLSYHNPMKKIQLLCNGCSRPIMNSPFYTCANEDELCSFVLHEWCTRLPAVVEDHPGHPQHTLFYSPNVPGKFFGVFKCAICKLSCNGFVYSCVECQYHVDVNCAFIPKEITHKAHPNHLLSIRVSQHTLVDRYCRMCLLYIYDVDLSFGCQTCDVHLHPRCALLLNQTITHKYDKHPMKLSYFPVENHKGEYFCEICEEELNPEKSFYHCHECVQSIHPSCAPSILQSETHMGMHAYSRWGFVFRYLNIKFGGIYYKTENVHPHPLSFAQGIATDGTCAECGRRLQYEMIFKCQQCKFAIHYDCCKFAIDYDSWESLSG